jgi:hypothetical protein
MKKVIIKSNRVGNAVENGVYSLNEKIFSYDFADKGESFTDENGVEWFKDSQHHKLRYYKIGAKFVKQESFSHGEMLMNIDEARELVKRLNDGCRNGAWVRLYDVVG